jgi:putative heme-binding domain-containing protein
MIARLLRIALAASTLIPAIAQAAAAREGDPFTDFVRKTEPLTPEQERLAFHLPPGFVIQLVAAEPDIGKPINLAFDEKGRLWLSQSREYPFPAPLDKPGRDAIKVLSDFNADGHARKITTFAEGLNIPIGLYPYRDGALAYSIPNIYFLHDTNHDGHADVKELFLGRFGFERDTHGMTSSFRRGYDGWFYANHGYNNTSVLTARDGSSITLTSGNTYRIKIDGSHIEQFTWGRVNPFGLMLDPLGDLFGADCETFPIYLLLRGAYYPSFGKPDDGLGFAPAMMGHKHGSTAIAGLVYYAATNFPPEFRDNIFVGNVVTCRIDRDSLESHGSTRIAKEMPDFLISDDPWFRPVDLQLGPDGAMYVADFYNRIIGHYEVPLDHPGRDRERGRVWRIVYVGTNAPPPRVVGTGADKIVAAASSTRKSMPGPEDLDLSRASVGKLIRLLAHPNITVRMTAMNQLTDRFGDKAVAPVTAMMRNRKSTDFQKIHGLWVLYRLGRLDPAMLATMAQDADRGVRTHAMRVIAETPDLHPTLTNLHNAAAGQASCDLRALVLNGLHDSDGYVRRAAADALGCHPELDNIRPLLDLLRDGIASDDTELRHMARMALRNQIISPANLTRFESSGLSEADSRALADVAVAVPSEASALFLVHHVRQYSEGHETLGRYLRHAARYLPTAQMDDLAAVVRQKSADDFDLQLSLFQSVSEGMAQRGGTLSEALRDWGREIAQRALVPNDADSGGWSYRPVEGMKETVDPWCLQKRASADDRTDDVFLSTLPAGEAMTGILRSPPFTVPTHLDFFLAGHDGPTGKPAHKKNHVRLLATGSEEILAEALPPRKDVAQKVSWDLAAHSGQQGFLEFTDGNDATAFAWLAFGRLNPEVVQLPRVAPHELAKRQQLAADLASTLGLTNLAPMAAMLLDSPGLDIDTRAALAKTVVALEPDDNLAALVPLIGDNAVTAEMRDRITESIVGRKTNDTHEVLVQTLGTAPYRVQLKLARNLAGTAAGAEILLATIEQGKAPAQLLLDRNLKDKLTTAKPERVEERIKQLSRNLAPASEVVQKLIDQRRTGYEAAKAKAADGAQVFTKNCSVCHNLDGQGGHVGPQLDGVGGRGLERLLEDVLDPSRNVDRAFRTHVIKLKDGDVITGLPRREEGELLVLADSTGKEISIPLKDIEQRRESETSLMPDNFGDAIPVDDFYNLMAFLLSRNNKTAAQR